MHRRYVKQPAKPLIFNPNGHSMIKPNYDVSVPSILLADNQLSRRQLVNRMVTKNVDSPADFSRGKENLAAQISIPEATIKAKANGEVAVSSSYDMTNTLSKHAVKNIVSHVVGKAVYAENVDVKHVTENIITFGVSDVADKSGIMPDIVENSLPDRYRSVIIRTAYDVLISSAIKMKTPSIEKLVIFGLSELASEFV